MLEEMKKMIAEQLSCDENEINLETSFKDDLGADSLDLFELVMALRHRSIIELNGCRVSDDSAKFPEAEMSQGIS